MSQTFKKRGELVVGVKQDVPNFGYKDPKTGTYSGIETDLAKMIADELKVKIRYVPVTAQTRGPLLDNEQVDMDIATFTITDERKKIIQLHQSLLYGCFRLFWSINLPTSKALKI